MSNELSFVRVLREAIAAAEAGDTATVRIPLDAADELLAYAPSSPIVDPDYGARTGYSPAFLGGTPVPLPALKGSAATDALKFGPTGAKTTELRYHHFSVVMSRSRRFARLTAVNIDGEQRVEFDRENDAWQFDPRIEKKFQVGNKLYAHNPFDRGHLVRRLDPVWGDSQLAAFANGDTFHFTNCAPQHEDFNRNPQVWAGIENYILDNAEKHDLKVSVFTGPVLRADDPPLHDVKVPREYWKVVAFRRKSGGLAATAYRLSQENLIPVGDEEFEFGKYKTFQVRVREVAELGRLNLDQLVSVDRFEQLDAETVAIPIERLIDIVL